MKMWESMKLRSDKLHYAYLILLEIFSFNFCSRFSAVSHHPRKMVFCGHFHYSMILGYGHMLTNDRNVNKRNPKNPCWSGNRPSTYTPNLELDTNTLYEYRTSKTHTHESSYDIKILWYNVKITLHFKTKEERRLCDFLSDNVYGVFYFRVVGIWFSFVRFSK